MGFRDGQSIISLCTPQGSGAVALLRLCGEDAVLIADKMAKLSSGKKLKECKTHTIHYGKVVSQDGVIDEVLFLLMRAPKTFTGEDTVEITSHNNPFITEQIIKQAILHGARRALPGEFSKRAVMNGKMDLLQAEAINEVIAAQTETALKKSMSQVEGTFSRYIKQLEEEIARLLAYVEASFEFLDEEQRELDLQKSIQEQFLSLKKKIKILKENFSQQKQIKEGVRIAIIGQVNAGKSTLFNALLNAERAIVTDVEGTTRDFLEGTVYKRGIFWTIIDTAGLRRATDFIEQRGIEHSFKEAQKADIILLLFDASKQFSEEQANCYLEFVSNYADKIIVVANKVDSCDARVFNKECFAKVVSVSAKNKHGLDSLLEKLEDFVQELFKKFKSPFLLNKRQHSLLCEAEKNLCKIDEKVGYELVAHSLKDALEIIGELTGKNANEKTLDIVFNDFCVGK